MPSVPLDFTKVEALRKHMLLTAVHMSKVLGVSRVTYGGWVKGKAIRKANEEKVKIMLRKMLKVVTEKDWPTPEIIALNPKQRMDTLLEILNEDE